MHMQGPEFNLMGEGINSPRKPEGFSLVITVMMMVLLALLGIENALLVTPSVYGMDNERQLDTLNEMNGSWRGVAVVPTDVAVGGAAEYAFVQAAVAFERLPVQDALADGFLQPHAPATGAATHGLFAVAPVAGPAANRNARRRNT